MLRRFLHSYGWSRFTNMLYLESPVGVGFSYCDTPPCKSNDTSTAMDSYDALLAFHARFPELAKRKFYITGESYAGICENNNPPQCVD